MTDSERIKYLEDRIGFLERSNSYIREELYKTIRESEYKDYTIERLNKKLKYRWYHPILEFLNQDIKL